MPSLLLIIRNLFIPPLTSPIHNWFSTFSYLPVAPGETQPVSDVAHLRFLSSLLLYYTPPQFSYLLDEIRGLNYAHIYSPKLRSTRVIKKHVLT